MYWGNCESGCFSLTVTWSGPVLVTASTWEKLLFQAAPFAGSI